MIITRVIGGLGNQLFQYAVGRSLAHKLNTDLKLDISGFETYGLHKFFLDKFNIEINEPTEKEIQKFIKKRGKISYYFTRLFTKTVYSTIYKKGYYREKKEFHFDPEILELKGDIYLDGYFQTDMYFKDIQEIIKDDITVKTEPSEQNAEYISSIQKKNSIAIHIRRGDYLTNKKTLSKHGIVGLDYYKMGIKTIVEKVSDPHFFIFSDDPEWVKENLIIDYPSDYVSHNDPDKGYEDLRLMTNCKHFIIANSTFSWWGAWLSRNSEKIIIAPKSWLKTKEIAVANLIPEDWLRI